MQMKKEIKNEQMNSAAENKSSSSNSSNRESSNSSNITNREPKQVNELMKELATVLFQFKRLESSGKAISQAQQDQAKAIVSELSKAEIKFLGLIAKCWIHGNDCHMLNSELEIMVHFAKEEMIDEGFEKARKMIPGLASNVMGLMVYNNSIQYLYIDGTTQAVEF